MELRLLTKVLLKIRTLLWVTRVFQVPNKWADRGNNRMLSILQLIEIITYLSFWEILALLRSSCASVYVRGPDTKTIWFGSNEDVSRRKISWFVRATVFTDILNIEVLVFAPPAFWLWTHQSGFFHLRLDGVNLAVDINCNITNTSNDKSCYLLVKQ